MKLLQLLVALVVAQLTSSFVVQPSAFVSASRNSFSGPAQSTKLEAVPIDVVQVHDAINTATTLIASTEKDFGGLLFPVGGIGLLAALILYLSPRLAD